MLETVGSVFSVFIELGKCLAAPLGRQFGYLRNYKTNFDSLKHEAEKLTDARERVHHRVDDAERQGEEIEQDVLRWLTRVDESIKEADKIIEDEGKGLCFKGLCPNLKTRYQLSKDAVRKLNDIKGLREEGKFEVVSYQTLPQEIWLPATKGYESFESRMKAMRDIQKALSDPNVSMIGVYGMGGIGKTTLVREIASQAEKDKLFDEVVFAHVSHNPDIRKIQGEIADKIGLEFRVETEPGRARKLRQRLSGGKKNPPTKDATDLDMERSLHTSSSKVETEAGRNTKQELSREKKVLVILDDIWKDLDLEKIGIPLGDDRCKVLLTARSQDVLFAKINCENNFPVGILPENEAWSLFQTMVGENIENRELKSVATDVANECGGLPIAIVTIARALRKKSIPEWKNALQELRRPSERSFEGIPAEAYKTLELSYNHLESEELKSIFLLCSLIDSEMDMTYLLKCGMGLGLLDGVGAMEAARIKLYTLVQKLKTSCLLIDGQTDEQFSMHDVIRAVGISIASRDKQALMVRDDSLFSQMKNKLKECTAIAFPHCNTSELPAESLECPQLRFLYIRNQGSSIKIPGNFFTGMIELQVLDFTSMQLSSLPSSLHLLQNLRTLCLGHCVLGDIAIVGELKKLEILSFSGSRIEQLPREIGQLSCLRLLDLNGCSKLEVIPPNVLSRLSRLEELYMGNTFVKWEIEGHNIERKNASLDDLKQLSRLTNLEIHIKDPKILPRGLSFEKLERYKIYIGDGWVWSEMYEGTRTLKLKINSTICIEHDVNRKLRGIEVLYLDEVQGANNALYKVDKEGFPQLKHLHVQNNSYFLCILDLMDRVLDEAFPQLESLLLSNLMNMEKISYGQLTGKSFCKLNTIKVDNCHKLKNIFSLSIVKSLPQLQTVEVTDCEAMEEIFELRGDEDNNNEVIDKIEFGQIRFLTLKSLPQLTCFCSKLKIASTSGVARDIEVVLEDEHDTPTTLFNEMVAFPELEEMVISNLDNLKTIWDNKVAHHSFRKLKLIKIEGCNELITLFPSNMFRWFLGLESLTVKNCDSLEEIFGIQELDLGETHSPFIIRLKQVSVSNCGSLKNIFQASVAKSLLQLQELHVESCGVLTEIVAMEQEAKTSTVRFVFPMVSRLTLAFLPKLTTFYPGVHILEWQVLEHLVVADCEKMLDFVNSRDEGQLIIPVQQPFFLVEKVELRNLENMEASATDFEKIWQNQCPEMASRFQNLKRLIVQGNDKLTFLFSSSIVRSFLQLQHLEICKCPALNVVVAIEESREEEERNNTMFPRLNFLKIEDVENLTGFCLENYVEFPSLKQLEINQCPEFKAFVLQNSSTDFTIAGEVEKMNSMEIQPFFNDKVSFPELEEMRISNLDNLKMIWDNKLAHDCFRKLKLIKVEGCNKLVTLFPSNLFRRFSRLEYLTIKNCASLEVLFGIQELDFVETHSPLIILLKQVSVFNCGRLQNVFEAFIAKNLFQLEKLEVNGCGVLTEIVAKERGEKASTIGFVFPMLGLLHLAFLPKLSTFYPGVHTSEWPVLEHLVVADCENVKTFALEMVEFGNTKDEGQLIPVQQPFFLLEKVIPRLKFLELNIKDIIMLCHGRFARLHFSKLDTLFIRRDEAAVFSPVLLERYTSLKTLLLCYSSYKEIFSHEDVEKHVENFGRIICLRLESLSQLKHIWRQDSKLNSILQNLEILRVEDCDNLINLVPSSASFRNLTILKVCYCVGLTNLISSSTAKSLESLKQMKIKGCKGMTDIVANEGNAGEDEIVLNKMEELSLVDLESLKSFSSMNYKFIFPSLDILIVRDCPKMKIFCEGAVSTSKLTMVCQSREDWKLDKGYWKDDLNTTIQQLQHNMVELRNLESMDVSTTDFEKICQNQCPEMTSRFQNLKRLVVKGSGNLTYLFSSSTVRSFLQLQHLEICKCPAVHEIIAMEELREEERKDIIFPQLNFLKIEDLENLTRFCLENYVEFPSLKQLEIKQCPNFKAFVLNNYIDLTTAGETGKMSSMDIQTFFNDKVALPDLEEMVVSHLDNLKMIWDNKLDYHSFSKLKSVKVEGCDKLLILFPYRMLGRLSRLDSLTVDKCGSLEAIFGIRESNFEETHSMLDLKLTTVKVTKCQNLKIIFPTVVARSLLQLERLEIIDCGILEEIVSKEGRGEASAVKFFFPKAACLVLENLPALTNFYPGVHISEWPMLEVLVVYGCEKVKVFATEYLYFQKAKDESYLDIPAEQPLLLVEKIIPRLELLALSGQEIMKILYGQFPRHLFSKIKTLGIKEEESAAFSLGLLERFYNLEWLKLRHGSYKELFSNGEMEKHARSLAGIKKLLLESLSDMKYLWKQDAKMNLVLQNLEILEVEKCDSLVTLLPPSAFFSNLTTLKVCYCNGMINLATSLTAKSLEHLTNISIEGCERMTEIIANDGDEAEDEIVFKKLEELSLVGLESLISFCSMNCAFNFPSLDVLIVRDCPKMKIFSEGALRISKLEIVCQNREDWFLDKGCWEGDLNTTIQKLHNKMNGRSSKEDSGQPSEHHMK